MPDWLRILGEALWWSLGQKETYIWWAAIQLVGLVAFPLTFAFFQRLPDRGYTFAKPLGLVLLGYILWMGSTIGLFPNGRGAVILILAVLAIMSFIVASRRWREMGDFLIRNWGYVFFVEALFAITLVVAASLRSYVADIAATEKPMDMAFLNAVVRGDQFPVEDPWLAGHSVPLYYFGHVMIGALTMFTGLRTGVTFNLGLALIGALSAIGIFGLVYNLLIGRGRPLAAVVFGMVAVGLLLVLANMEGLFELMARHGVGNARFYQAIGIDGLDGPTNCKANAGDCGKWYPTAWWFWWRATRIATQWDWREFPFFTFMLGDLHAHLLSIPFVLMAMAIALNTLRWQGPLVGGLWPGVALALNRLRGNIGGGSSSGTVALSSVTPVPPGAYPVAAEHSLGLLASAWEGFTYWVAHAARFLAMSVLVGSLGFINSWDLPTFLGLVCFAAGVRNYLSEGRLSMSVVGRSLGFTVPLAVLSFVLYLPFYVNFHPVGGAILPIQLAPIKGWPPIETMATRPHHFAYLWATILWPTLTFAVVALGPWRLNRSILWWAMLPAFVPFLAWLFLVTASHGPVGLLDEIRIRGPESNDISIENLESVWWITLVFLLAAVTIPALAFGRYLLKAREKENAERDGDESLAFALAVGGVAILILLGTELYWVYDPVNVRSNTVFRLNYQSWIMLAVSGAVGFYYITSRWRLSSILTSVPRLFWVFGTIFFIGSGLVYPVIASMNRTVGFTTGQYLDGLEAMKNADPSEFEAVRWLEDNVEGTPTILEAIGPDYSPENHGRISSRTGIPTLLGWPDHEYRWRDSWKGQGTKMPYRAEAGAAPGTCFDGEDNDGDTAIDWADTDCRLDLDVKQAYQTTSAEEALDILKTYDVEYVYVGALERETYGEEGLAKFATFMDVAYQNSGVTIYRMPDTGQVSVRAP
jgi:uncharacterized membrane protein